MTDNTELIPLQLQHLELLRNWRNDKFISRFLVTQTHITPRMQQEWFHNLDPQTHKYFIVLANGKPIGCAQLRHINLTEKSAEPGIFIGIKEYMETGSAALAIINLLQKAFHGMGLKTLTSSVHRDNILAINNYRKIGFRIEEAPQQEYWTTRIDSDTFFAFEKKLPQTRKTV